jgi:hypothetical protein
MKVQVASENFASKKALYERLRVILHGYPQGTFVPEADAAFLTAALQSANAFYGYPVEDPVSWRIQQQATGTHSEFVFTRPDGTRENPSIRRLSLQKSRTGKTARMAARREISPQVIAFRNERRSPARTFACDECSVETANIADFEVDHDAPTFAQLFETFVAQLGIEEASLKVHEIRDNTGLMVDFGLEPGVAALWRSYHGEHARLQLLCRGCHVHKTFRYDEQGGEPC